MVPSLPTFFIASEMMFPMDLSPLAEIVATCYQQEDAIEMTKCKHLAAEN